MAYCFINSFFSLLYSLVIDWIDILVISFSGVIPCCVFMVLLAIVNSCSINEYNMLYVCDFCGKDLNLYNVLFIAVAR